MKAFICIGYVYSFIKINDICYYISEKTIDNRHVMVTILYNNKYFSMFKSDFEKKFISLSEQRKNKLNKIISNNF